MSGNAVGKLVDEHGAPWPALGVELIDASALFGGFLARGKCDAQGKFALAYDSDAFVARLGPRRLELVVRDHVPALIMD